MSKRAVMAYSGHVGTLMAALRVYEYGVKARFLDLDGSGTIQARAGTIQARVSNKDHEGRMTVDASWLRKNAS